MGNPALVGALAGSTGVVGLRLGWRKRALGARIVVATAWLLLGVAGYVCAQRWGSEFGISYFFSALALVAWLLVLCSAELRPPRVEKAAGSVATGTSTGHKWLTFIAAGPLAGFACCQLTLALTYLLPATELTRVAIAAVLFPVMWGIVAAVSCMLGQPGRAAILFLGIAVLSSLSIYL